MKKIYSKDTISCLRIYKEYEEKYFNNNENEEIRETVKTADSLIETADKLIKLVNQHRDEDSRCILKATLLILSQMYRDGGEL